MIYLRKNEIFYENNYNPDSDEYVFTKVKSFIPYLDEIIHIDQEVTLADVFLLFENDNNLVEIIFGSQMGHHPLSVYIEDIKKSCMDESREELEYIACSWRAEQFDYKKFYDRHKKDKTDPILGPLHEPDEDDVNEVDVYVDVHGWGKYVPADGEEEFDLPEHGSYAIEFTPLYRMKHLPIRLDKKFVIKEQGIKGDEEKTLVEGIKEFTVYEVFGALLGEITFAGLPEDRDKRWNDVLDSIDDYKKKMDDEDIDLDDLKDMLDEDDN
jgi:hypothetical protein